MTTVNIPFDHIDVEMNCSRLISLLFANPTWDICLFNDGNKDGDPLEYTDIHHAVEDIVHTYCLTRFNVGLRMDASSKPYFCITVL